MDNLALQILQRSLKDPRAANVIEDHIDELPKVLREQLLRRMLQLPEISPEEAANGSKTLDPFISADFILKNQWPEPVWIIPGVIPTGLTIVGGAPKLGKSWFALQIAQAVASGGMTFDKSIDQGSVLYLALEDPPRRLQERMIKQHWQIGLPCDFLTVGRFQETIGDLRNGGAEKLAKYIMTKQYRLVIIDTLSRAITGDQNEVSEMTIWLTPIQEISHEMNCCIALLDHHNKVGSADAVRDILGSTAKGAMADTIIGLYRERGKPDARVTVTGREVEEQTINVRFDKETYCWQVDANPTAGLTADQADLIHILEEIQPATLKEIVDALGKDYEKQRGSVLNRLVTLQHKYRVERVKDDKWQLSQSKDYTNV